ncbi:glycosyltransferase family 4 protein [Roseofilum sp. BLCC_M154]|uniref:Glycosyltransferase family 4 protein n=1 Tax=Roseofilum acuticapitatum BLCC-M154 TaxID=3022444 RepID=A0ABT7AWW4_9CYAN|nr:glycosyltransferase family 4 protein [Roseofilum acuticapitatum]MDJ1171067.1 glycosyltransferase family 4 protein [Roseofilum acuticapitatum BLCC-M154]
MKLAFVTHSDLYNSKSWPRGSVGNWGSNYWMAKMLEQQAESFLYIGALQQKHSIFAKLERRFYETIFSQQEYLYWAEPSVNQNYCQQIIRQLELWKPDIIFSPNLLILAYLKYNRPKVLWTDTTCGGIPEVYRNTCWRSKQYLKAIDFRALQNVELAIFSSEWAAETAKKLYNVNAKKLKVVTTGANMECDRTPEEIQHIIGGKSKATCHLLFIGVDWYRKGGNIALDVGRSLHQFGFPVQLTIVGTRLPQDEPIPDFVTVIDFIDKSTEKGREQLNSIFAQAHFLILPSRADVTPAVIREASSFGLPSLSTQVGGIPTLIREGKNGKTFALNAKIEEYHQYIQSTFYDWETYQALATCSFQEYQERLNWDKAGELAYKLMQDLIEKP